MGNKFAALKTPNNQSSIACTKDEDCYVAAKGVFASTYPKVTAGSAEANKRCCMKQSIISGCSGSGKSACDLTEATNLLNTGATVTPGEYSLYCQWDYPTLITALTADPTGTWDAKTNTLTASATTGANAVQVYCAGAQALAVAVTASIALTYTMI